MSFYKFNTEDIINSQILTFPSASVSKNGSFITGSVYLERPFLMTALSQRVFTSFSPAAASILSASGPFTSSIEIIDAVSGGLNSGLFKSINVLYNYYHFLNSNYTSSFSGTTVGRYRVIVIPEVYYDKQITTGTFVANDFDVSGSTRTLYDDGNGGIYSGSITGTLVGNIFYNEGLVVLKGGGFNDLANNNEFGVSGSSTSFLSWSISFLGNHTIPVKIFRCRAPAGQLNASTNPTYFQIDNNTSSSLFPGEKQIVTPTNSPYITTIGLYNDHYELVGIAKLAQPIKKDESADLLFRLHQDW